LSDAQVAAEKRNIALKKWPRAGRPASTTAIMKIEWEPLDCPAPLMNGWSEGTRKDAVRIDSAYRVITRSEIFRDAIFMASESARALLSAAVTVTISMPVYEKKARMHAVLCNDIVSRLFFRA
jgi:hypothetical protein